MRCFISFLILLLTIPAVVSAEPVEATDQVVQEVIRMLEADVSERIVERWLDAGDRTPEALSSDDLIALTEAGASEELIERLLSTMRVPEAAVEKPMTVPPAPVPPPGEMPAMAAEEGGAAVPTGAAPGLDASVPTSAGADSPIDAYFKVLYRSSYDEFEEGTRPWDLFVYMDGQYLAWVKVNKKDPVEFFRQVAPGPHRFVVMQQRHELKSKKSGRWNHEYRVSPAPLDLDLDAGGEMEIEISFEQDWIERRGQGPLSARTLRKRTEIDVIKRVGEPAAFWPGLCEGESSARGKCLKWTSLWPEGIEVADWETLQAAAEATRFEPPPAAGRLN